MVHVRVDEQIKAQATETLAAMGLSVSDAVRVFLMRVVADKQMPFALKAQNTFVNSFAINVSLPCVSLKGKEVGTGAVQDTPKLLADSN